MADHNFSTGFYRLNSFPFTMHPSSQRGFWGVFMPIIEHSVSFDITAFNPVTVGGPLAFHLRATHIPIPEGIRLTSSRATTRSVPLGLFQKPRENGQLEYWLIHSWPYRDTPEAPHDQFLLDTEPQPWSRTWLCDCRFKCIWWKPNSDRLLFRITPGTHARARIWEFFEALSLTHLLTPSLRPACFRIGPAIWQTWIYLGTVQKPPKDEKAPPLPALAAPAPTA